MLFASSVEEGLERLVDLMSERANTGWLGGSLGAVWGQAGGGRRVVLQGYWTCHLPSARNRVDTVLMVCDHTGFDAGHMKYESTPWLWYRTNL